MKRMLLVALLLVGCSREPAAPQPDIDWTPRDADVETCTACGMVVREQPAPRGQVIHRDGTRVFLCDFSMAFRALRVSNKVRGRRRWFAERFQLGDRQFLLMTAPLNNEHRCYRTTAEE